MVTFMQITSNFNTHSLAGVYQRDAEKAEYLKTFQYSLPLRECIIFIILCRTTLNFNTHSLAGVYRFDSRQQAFCKFQYSLPCGSVSQCTPDNFLMSDFNTHSLAGVYHSFFFEGEGSYFNTHSLAGVYHNDVAVSVFCFISILTPLRECIESFLKFWYLLIFQYSLPCGSVSASIRQMYVSAHFNTHSLAGVYLLSASIVARQRNFNTHSLAGVYPGLSGDLPLKIFQYSLPCGSVSMLRFVIMIIAISILTPLRECINS